jgi:hypothetical protein
MNIKVSTGEVLDKLSILSIKLERVKDSKKLVNIQIEFDYLLNETKSVLAEKLIYQLYLELLEINKKLWNIEDNIRLKEKVKEFDSKFIQLARSVYIHNDIRAEIKKKINLESNSHLSEEKSYEQY